MKTSYSISPKYKTRAITKKKKNAVPAVSGEAVVVPNVILNVDSVSAHRTATGSRSVTFAEVFEPPRVSEHISPPALVEVSQEEHAVVELSLEPVQIVPPNAPKPVTVELVPLGTDDFIPSSATEDNTMLSGFLQEPFKTVDLIVNGDEIEKLNIDKEKFGSDYWLSTNLIDFLIKYGIPLFKSEEILVPTCINS